MSLLNTDACGFIKAFLYEISCKLGVNYKAIKKELDNEFQHSTTVTYEEIKRRTNTLKKHLQNLGKTAPEKKKLYLSWFSLEEWKKLNEKDKVKHSPFTCFECSIKYKYHLGLLSSTKLKGKSNSKNIVVQLPNINPKSSRFPLKEITDQVYHSVNTQFENITGVDFATAQSNSKNINLIKTSSKTEIQKKRRTATKSIVKKIQDIQSNTNILRLYGTRKSLRSHDHERLAKSFEPYAAAKRKADDQDSSKPRKKVCGPFEHMNFEKDALISEVTSYNDDQKINFTKLATKYKVVDKTGKVPKNGGQIVKEFLKEKQIDLSRFTAYNGHGRKSSNDQKVNIRRRKLRLTGNISMPSDDSSCSIRTELQNDVAAGKYLIGESIIPRDYVKLSLKDGEIKESTFSVCGRKITLKDIREKLLVKERPYMRTIPDFESLSDDAIASMHKALLKNDFSSRKQSELDLRNLHMTRHLQIWHDNSTIANNGYFLVTVNTCYDPLIHMTRQEYQEKTGTNIDVQVEIENPEIHILSKASSCMEDIIAFSSTRLECIKETTDIITLKDGFKIIDKMRFFHGDDPSAQVESGHQKGGNFFCPSCPIKATETYSLETAYRKKIETLTDKQEKVLKGPIGRSKSLRQEMPFVKLSKDQLESELRGRGLIKESKEDRDVMAATLINELKGTKSVPALLHDIPTKDVATIALRDYEVLPFEPCHDIAGHIKNIYSELPHHLNKDEGDFLKSTIEISFGKKDTKRSVDYRCSIIKVSHVTRGKICYFAHQILDTMVELQMLAYGGESKRNQAAIFRFNNQSFLHFTLCRIVIGFNLKSITTRKFYGSYLHALVPHGGLQLRIVSGMTAFAEAEERLFQQAKGITKQTSNNHPGHIVGNILVRSQVEDEFKTYLHGLKGETWEKEQDVVSSLYKAYYVKKNTIIPKEFIRKYPGDWQSFLETIADFLIIGEGKSWKVCERGIEFLDSSNEQFQVEPPIHHFRSWNLKEEQEYLEGKWKMCLKDEKCIPANLVNIYNEAGDFLERKYLNNIRSLLEVGNLHEEDVTEIENVICEEEQGPVEEVDCIELRDAEEREFKDHDGEEFQPLVNFEISDAKDDTASNQNLNVTPSQSIITSQAPSNATSATTSLTEKKTTSPLGSLDLPTPNFKLKTAKTKFKPFITSTPCNNSHQKQSKTVTNLEKLFGTNDTMIQDFDKYKRQSKAMPKNKELKESLWNCVAHIETKLSAKLSSLKKQYKDWEKEWFVRNDFTCPNSNDIQQDSVARSIKSKIDICRNLQKYFQSCS